MKDTFVTRAVHIEEAFSLEWPTNDSFQNGFFRMVSRRGLPAEEILYKTTALLSLVEVTI